MQGDLRAALQYVPSFSGKVFVIVLDVVRMPELALAEALLDLSALQQIGVRLVMVSTGEDGIRLEQLLIDGELKWEAVDMDLHEVVKILDRGQLALVKRSGIEALGDEVVRFAMELGAFKLIVLGPGQVAGGNSLSCDAAESWQGRDAALLKRAAEVCQGGIPRVHLLNESHQGVLMDELFSNEGVGVMVYADDYLSIRSIAPDDIPELLAMVGRSMRDAHLVPRSYEEIESVFEDFLVMTVDGNVVGCVALHGFDDPACGEVACLYVKQSHGGQGYGKRLVEAAEARARKLGLPAVFALSTRAVEFFQEKLGYESCSIDEIPAVRRERLLSSGRNSLIIRKSL